LFPPSKLITPAPRSETHRITNILEYFYIN